MTTQDLRAILDAQQEYPFIYIITINGKIFILREPLLSDWLATERFMNSKINSDSFLVNKLLVYPEISDLRTGEIIRLGEEAFKIVSKFADDEVIQKTLAIERKKLAAGDSIESLILMICSAFPSYSPEDIYLFTFDKLMTRIAQAEMLLNPPKQGQLNATVSPLQAESIHKSSRDLNVALSKGKSQGKPVKKLAGTFK